MRQVEVEPCGRVGAGLFRLGRGKGAVATTAVGLGACVIGALVLAGCAGRSADSTAFERPAPRAVEPAATSSATPAAPAAPATGVSAGAASAGAAEGTPEVARAWDLEFLELLDRRAAVSCDDVLTGLHLVRTGQIGLNFIQRVESARGAGLIGPDFSRRAREAMNAGALAPLVLAALGEAPAPDAEAALSRVQDRGWLPRALRADSLVSGPQLLAVLGALGDELAKRGQGAALPQRGRPAQVPAVASASAASKSADDAFDELGYAPGASTTGASTSVARTGVPGQRVATASTAASARGVSSASGLPRPRPEPLPALVAGAGR